MNNVPRTQGATFDLDNSAGDAFSRLRVSEPVALFSAQFQYDLEPLRFEQIIADSGGAGTPATIVHTSDTRMAQLGMVAEPGITKLAALQSYSYIPYQPGKSHRIFVTFVMRAAVADVRERIGYFDGGTAVIDSPINGVLLERDTNSAGETTISFAVYYNGTRNSVAQADWNVDTLDGLGASAIELDLTKPQILVIDLQYLGMGRVRCGFDIGGKIIIAHQFMWANDSAAEERPYMQTGSLPVRCEIFSTNALQAMYMKCCEVSSEGGADTSGGYIFSTGSQLTCAVNNRRYIIAALRPKTTFNSITNRIDMTPVTYEVGVVNSKSPTVTNGQAIFEVIYGATPDSALTFADVNATHSGMEAYLGDGTKYVSSIANAVIADSVRVPFGGTGVGAAVRGGNLGATSMEKYHITLDCAGAVRSMGTVYLVGQTSADTTDVRLVGDIGWKETR